MEKLFRKKGDGRYKKMQRILFICLANINRSPTAERVFREMAEKRGIEVKVSSAGIDVQDGDTENPLSEFLVKNADKIFVMEEYMKNIIVKNYNADSVKIESLEIPDIYRGNDLILTEILRERLEPYLMMMKASS